MLIVQRRISVAIVDVMAREDVTHATTHQRVVHKSAASVVRRQARTTSALATKSAAPSRRAHVSQMAATTARDAVRQTLIARPHPLAPQPSGAATCRLTGAICDVPTVPGRVPLDSRAFASVMARMDIAHKQYRAPVKIRQLQSDRSTPTAQNSSSAFDSTQS